MFATVLSLHILTALAMGLCAVLTLVGVWKSDLVSVRKQSKLLAWGLGFELVSGSLLSVLASHDMSFFQFCQNVILYLFTTGSVLTIAYARLRDEFPSAAVLVPVLPGLFISTLAALRLW